MKKTYAYIEKGIKWVTHSRKVPNFWFDDWTRLRSLRNLFYGPLDSIQIHWKVSNLFLTTQFGKENLLMTFLDSTTIQTIKAIHVIATLQDDLV